MIKHILTGRHFSLFAAFLAIAFSSGPLHSHHSVGMFDADNPRELVGTVSEWIFSNPHCFIMLDVTDEDGTVTTWTLEGASPNVIYRQGWTPHSLQPGDQIIATVRPLRSGAAGGNYSNLRWQDGSAIDPRAPRP